MEQSQANEKTFHYCPVCKTFFEEWVDIRRDRFQLRVKYLMTRACRECTYKHRGIFDGHYMGRYYGCTTCDKCGKPQ